MKTLYFFPLFEKKGLLLCLASLLLSCLPDTASAQQHTHKIFKSFKLSEQQQSTGSAPANTFENLTALRVTGASDISRPRTRTEYFATETGWELTSIISITYDAMGRETEELHKNSDGTNSSRSVSSFDTRGNQTEHIRYMWFGTNWMITSGSQTAYTYDASGRITERVEKEWNEGVWEFDSRSIYTYNTSGSILTESVYSWEASAWVLDSRDSYTYSTSDSRLTGVVAMSANEAGVLENDYRIIDVVWHTYSIDHANGYPEGTPSSYIEQEWVNGNWVNSEKYSATFGQNNSFVAIYQEWENNAWVNESRNTINFDAQGNLTLMQMEEWVDGKWEMDTVLKMNHTYNTSNQLTESIMQLWDEDSQSFINFFRSVFSDFQTITSVSKGIEAFLTEIYPNPTADRVSVRFAQLASHATVSVSDLTGKVIFSKQLPSASLQMELDLTAFPAGLYLLQVYSGKAVATKKIMKQ